jgi:hypothetical protein
MRTTWTWTCLLLLLALVLRLGGLGFGLHGDDPALAELGNSVDERAMARAVLNGALAGRVDPGVFLYWGSGAFWTFGLVDALATLPGGMAETLASWHGNLSGLVLLHRMVSALAGVLTVLVLMRLVQRERGLATALTAGALLATCYLHVRESHFGTTDALLTLWITVAMSASQRWLRARQAGDDRSGRWALVAGLAAGLAAATKTVGVLGLCLPAAAWLMGRRAGRPHGAVAAGRELSMAGLAAGAAWLALSPHVFTSGGEMLEHLRSNSERFGAGPWDVLPALWHHLVYSLGVGFGWLGLALGGVGLVALANGPSDGDEPKRSREFLALLAVPFLFLLVFRLTASRYALPVLPALSALAAVGASALARRLASEGAARTAALWILVLAASASSIVRSVTLDALLLQRDTRVDAAAALRELEVPREQVLAFGLYGLPSPHQGDEPAAWVSFLRRASVQGADNPFERLDGGGLAFLAEAQAAVRSDPPRVLLHERSHEALDALGWEELTDLVDARYERIASFDGRRDGVEPALPDERSGSPTFFVPWASPWLMDRPGPALDIYLRRDE